MSDKLHRAHPSACGNSSGQVSVLGAYRTLILAGTVFSVEEKQMFGLAYFFHLSGSGSIALCALSS